jgi:hypothetical protein
LASAVLFTKANWRECQLLGDRNVLERRVPAITRSWDPALRPIRVCTVCPFLPVLTYI